MKYRHLCDCNQRGESLPVRGAWIEMAIGIPVMAGVWSLPVRGAWIEMSASRAASCASKVAPRAGSVD